VVKHPDVVAAGDASELSRVTIVALYDPNDGSILHLHQVFAFAGSAVSTEDDAIAAARRNARNLDLDAAGWSAAVSHDPEHGRRSSWIDVSTGQFRFRDDIADRKRDRRGSK
jgi:hypothetical protein